MSNNDEDKKFSEIELAHKRLVQMSVGGLLVMAFGFAVMIIGAQYETGKGNLISPSTSKEECPKSQPAMR